MITSISPLCSLFFFLVVFKLPFESSSQSVPTWLANTYVRTGSRNVIINKTDDWSATRSATITFTTAFSVAPKLVYGVQNYQCQDTFLIENYYLNRGTLSATSFSISVFLYSGSTFYKLGIRYFAIAPTFPYKLTCLESIPINYQKTLTNITSKSSVLRFFTNDLNFTKLANAVSASYNKFSLPLSNNRIVPFLTTMDISGTTDQLLPPIGNQMKISTQVLNTDLFRVNVTFGFKAFVYAFKFCYIVYDEKNIYYSNTYYMVGYGIDVKLLDGGFSALNSNFVNTMIVGFIGWNSQRTYASLVFNLAFQNNSNNTYGIVMPPSSILPTGVTPVLLTTISFSISYMITYSCPTNSFLDPVSLTCIPCAIPHCATCLNLDTCQACDSVGGYILTSTAPINQQCSPCSTPNCVSCPVTTSCTLCDQANNYFLNSTSQCEICTLAYCLNCTTLTQCNLCDQQNGYFLDTFSGGSSRLLQTGTCVPCSIPNCIKCFNLTDCQICDSSASYTVNPTSSSPSDQCIYCGVDGCLICQYALQCQTCDTDSGYFLNATVLQCYPCSVPYCIQCSQIQVCVTCNYTEGYFLNASATLISEQCQLCNISSCLTCSSLTQCLICDQANGYFKDTADKLCYPCALDGCIQCKTLAQCLTCDSLANYTLNPNTSLCQPPFVCNLTGCLSCTNLSSCISCDMANNYFLSSLTSLCQACSLSNCLSCSSLSACSSCDLAAGYVLNNITLLCETVTPPPPLVAICGDGLVGAGEQCDDGNFGDGDGCSSLCMVEQLWVCAGQPSICTYQGQVKMDVKYIQKIDNSNQIQIFLQIPQVPESLLSKLTPQMFSLPPNLISPQIVISPNGSISIIASYSQDLQNTNITVSFNASSIPALSGNGVIVKQFQVVPYDDYAYYYDDDVYDGANKIGAIGLAIGGIGLGVFVLGMFGRKIVGLEMMAVLQIGWIGLICIHMPNPGFKALTNIWFINGYNLFFSSKLTIPSSTFPSQFHPQLFPQFALNYNLTFLLVIVPQLLFLIFFALYRCLSSHPLSFRTFGRKCLHEYTFNGLMFSCYIVGAALGIEIMYGFKEGMQGGIAIGSVLFGAIMLVYIGGYALGVWKWGWRFGEFWDQFGKQGVIYPGADQQEKQDEKAGQNKQQCKRKISNQTRSTEAQPNPEQQLTLLQKFPKKFYILLLILQPLTTIVLTAIALLPLSPLLPISTSLVLLLLVCLTRPYIKFYHNVRFVVNMILTMGIFGIYLAYNFVVGADGRKSKEGIWTIMPWVVLGLMAVAVGIGAVATVYEIYRWCKQRSNENYKKRTALSQQTQMLQLMQSMSMQHSPQSLNMSSRLIPSPTTKLNAIGELQQIKKQIKKQCSLQTSISITGKDNLNMSSNIQNGNGNASGSDSRVLETNVQEYQGL